MGVSVIGAGLGMKGVLVYTSVAVFDGISMGTLVGVDEGVHSVAVVVVV